MTHHIWLTFTESQWKLVSVWIAAQQTKQTPSDFLSMVVVQLALDTGVIGSERRP